MGEHFREQASLLKRARYSPLPIPSPKAEVRQGIHIAQW